MICLSICPPLHAVCFNTLHQLKNSARSLYNRIVDELTFERNRRRPALLSGLESSYDLARPFNVACGRREDFVHDRHLIGVNAHLALKAERLDIPRRVSKTFSIVQIDPNGVDRRFDICRTRGQDALAAIGQKLSLAAAPHHAHVEREISRAERDASDARASGCDRANVCHALASLDDGYHVAGSGRQISLLLEVCNHPVGCPDLVDRLDLWQYDSINATLHDGHDIAITEFARHGVDPDISEGLARALAGGNDEGAGRLLLRDWTSILEIEDRRIGIE